MFGKVLQLAGKLHCFCNTGERQRLSCFNRYDEAFLI